MGSTGGWRKRSKEDGVILAGEEEKEEAGTSGGCLAIRMVEEVVSWI